MAIDFVWVAPQQLLGFSMWIELFIILGWGSKLTWFLCGWSKPTLLWCAPRRLFGFCVWMEIDLVWCGDRKLRRICVRAENDLALGGHQNGPPFGEGCPNQLRLLCAGR